MTGDPHLDALLSALLNEKGFWVRFTALDVGEDARDGSPVLRLERRDALPIVVRVNDEGFVVKIGDHAHKWCRLSIPDAVAMVMPPGAAS